MSKKLTTKQETIDWYWPDFLDYCYEHNKTQHEFKEENFINPTVDNFWKWYISISGPFGVKKALKFYSRTEAEYV